MVRTATRRLGVLVALMALPGVGCYPRPRGRGLSCLRHQTGAP